MTTTLAHMPTGSPPRAVLTTRNLALRTALLLLLLYLFLVGVNGLGNGFKLLSMEMLNSFFAATENPFIGLMIGILATTLVQSSSVSTAIIVGLVAAPENPLPVIHAVPMIMGANIGTTVTNTIASLAHMGRREDFRRAFAVATCHDFFNYFAVMILLPLELMTGFLAQTASALSESLGGMGGSNYESPIKGALEAGAWLIAAVIGQLTSSRHLAAILVIGVSAVLIVVTLLSIVSVMRSVMLNHVESLVTRAFENKPIIAMAVGMIATVMVQSSSITTSLLVPLAGAGVLTLAQAFPITLGANIGTTVTALLAALAATGAHAQAGLTIALVHLLFNVSGILLVYPVPAVRRLPLAAARGLADIAVKSRVVAILYIVGLFYLLPAVIAVVNRALN